MSFNSQSSSTKQRIGVAPMRDTPVERIRLLIDGKSRNVYLKLEGHNPGGSVKDRTALGLLQSLEATGQLRAGVSSNRLQVIWPSAWRCSREIAAIGSPRWWTQT
jgi:threonine synthase